VESIRKAADKGEDFRKAFKSFLDQSGVPYVQTKVSTEGGKTVLHLTQSRYLPTGSTGDRNRVWGVPVCVRYGTASGSKVSCELLDKATGTITLEGASSPTWVLANANASGYYRFSIDKADLPPLVKVASSLSDGEQLVYADALDAGFNQGDLDAHDVLVGLKPLTSSKTREVAAVPTMMLNQFYYRLAKTDAQRAAVVKYAQDAYLPRMEQLGYKRKAGEPDSDSLQRAALAEFLGGDMRIAEVRKALLAQGDAALKPKADGRLDLGAADPDLLGVALGVATQEHGKPAVDALIAELPKNSDPQQRNAILAGLAETSDTAQLNRVRDYALTKDVKVGEMAALLRGGRETRAQRDALWNWATANYDKIVARTGSFAGGALPRLMGGGGCSEEEATRLTDFFATRAKNVSGAERGLAQTTEGTKLCAAGIAKQDPTALTR
jgi:alanyl aminopeptidase